MSHPSSGQPWQGQPEQNPPPYGGYTGGPGPDPGASSPFGPDQPYGGGSSYPNPQQPPYNSDPNYGGPQPYGAPQESYTTEPPYSGQPYSGQPYSGQPYSGQPHSGQPYQGQQYDQGFAQQPPYDQGFQQPGGYQQPQQPGGFPQPGQGFPPMSPTPARRGRGGLIAAIIGGLAVLLLVCGVGGVLLVRQGDDDPGSDRADPVASASPTPSTKAEYPATILLPDSVAGLTRVTNNAELNQSANETATQLKNDTDADSAAAAYYAPGGDLTKIVGFFGVTVKIANPSAELTTAFNGETLKASNVTDVPPGPLGGLMKCGNTSIDGSAASVCGWADGGSLALGIFFNRSTTDSANVFRQMRSEVLRRG